ncbi:hypothetical protein [Membranihabitans maritimus]|uniref:hypothetical protein n=1 Tax=Membranihabitans maritimus TaxID=2904244 RepID=UPI001F3F1465|nr:hypothetical protein [Membranihabitans maritimus]
MVILIFPFYNRLAPIEPKWLAQIEPLYPLRKSVTEKITAQAVTWLTHRLSPENKQKFLRKKDGV